MAQNGRQSTPTSWWSWLIVAAAIIGIVAWAVVRTRAGIREASLAAGIGQEQALPEPLSMETHGDCLMPLLAPGDLRSELPAGATSPYTPVESLGLEILYVLDAEHSVRYLTKADLDQLGVSRQELHERAMENLRKTLSREAVRSAFEGPNLVSIKSLDTYDATRLLLLPEHLEPGEELGAAVPDRDTLTFAEIVSDSGWRMLEELGQAPTSDKVLLARPVRVTREGLELK